MAEKFDPYRKWLGIPPEEQPPHHYRLLGVGLFESDPDVIAEAADRQMAHVQTHKLGRYSAFSQKLLNELTAAKLALLNAPKKAAYDQALREKLSNGAPPVSATAVTQSGESAATSPSSASPGHSSLDFVSDTARRPGRGGRRPAPKKGRQPQSKSTSGAIAWMLTAGGVVVGAAVLFYAFSGGNGDSTSAANNNKSNSTDRKTSSDKKPTTPKKEPFPADHSPKAVAHNTPNNGSKQPGPKTDRPNDSTQTVGDTAHHDVTPVDKPADKDPAIDSAVEIAAPKIQVGEVRRLDGHQKEVRALAILPAGWRAISGSHDNTLRIWDYLQGAESNRLDGHTEGVEGLALAGDGRHLATAGHDKTVRWWNVDDRKEERKFKGPQVPMMCVAVSADGHYAAGGGEGTTVYIWETATGEIAQELNNFTAVDGGGVFAVALSADGSRVFIGFGGKWPSGKLTSSDDHSIRMIDWKDQHEVRLEGHAGGVWGLAVSPDGHRLASAGHDHTIRIWDADNGSPIRTLEGHQDVVWSVAFSKNGRQLLSGSEDKTVRLWDVDAGHELYKYEGHTGGVHCVGFSPDGRYALSGGSDNSLRLWQLPESQSQGAAPAELFAQPAPSGEAIPDAAAQEKALQMIKDVYQADYKALRKPADKHALAEKLLLKGNQSKDANERFVLLTQARDLAREAGSPMLMIQAIEQLGGAYALDMLDMLVESTEQMAHGGLPAPARKEMAESVLLLIDQAANGERYEPALRLLEVAKNSAAKSGDKEMAKQLRERQAEIAEQKKIFDAAKAAADSLAKSPDDADANLAFGKYLCFVKDDWNQGLPLLAKGSDEKLKGIAQREVAHPASPEEQLNLANDWYDLAEASGSKDKSELRSRAEHWYALAEPRLSGLAQTKAAERLEKLSAFRSPGAVGVGVAAPERPIAGSPLAGTQLAMRITKAVQRKALRQTKMVGGDGSPFIDIPQGKSPMLLGGFRYTLDKDRISSIQAVYVKAQGTLNGNIRGSLSGQVKTLLARNGYAVSGIKIKGEDEVEFLEVIFAKIDRNGLDNKDTYTERIVGEMEKDDPAPETLAADGQPVIGIFGMASGGRPLAALGLVQIAAP